MVIIKNYNFPGFKMQAKIYDGRVLLNTNQPQITKQIYEMALKENRHVYWIERTQTCIEDYYGKSEIEILEIVENEINGVKQKFKDQGYDKH